MKTLRFRMRGPAWRSIGVILFVALLAPPAMVSADGGDTSLIHACVNPSALARIVGPNDACSPSETPVHWSLGQPTGPAAVTVNCNAGQTITQALQTPGTPLTITVTGTCNENVLINRGAVTLIAGMGGATVNGPNANTSTITVIADGVLIDGLTVTGGQSGISAVGADRMTVRNCIVQNTGSEGITFFQGGTGTVDNCTVQNAGRNGIAIIHGATATVINSTISGNTGAGIHVPTGSSARIGISPFLLAYAPNTISNNGSSGISVANGSAALIGGNTISGNGTNPAALFGRSGISVLYAKADIVGSNTITSNAGSGVSLLGSDILIGDPTFGLSTANTITGNNTSGAAFEGGVLGFLGSSLDIRNATINGNTGNGVTLSTRSTAQMFSDTVNNNTGHGILLTRGSGLLLQSPAVTVTGNAGFGLECFGTEASFSGDTSGIGGNGAGMVSGNCTGF